MGSRPPNVHIGPGQRSGGVTLGGHTTSPRSLPLLRTFQASSVAPFRASGPHQSSVSGSHSDFSTLAVLLAWSAGSAQGISWLMVTYFKSAADGWLVGWNIQAGAELPPQEWCLLPPCKIRAPKASSKAGEPGSVSFKGELSYLHSSPKWYFI